MTRPVALRHFDRAAIALLLLFALGLAANLVWSALASNMPGEIIIGLPGIVWLSLPAAAAAAFVCASSTRAGAAAFLVLEVLQTVPVVIGWGGPISLLMLPLLQIGAIILVFLAAVAFGWRMRADFLQD